LTSLENEFAFEPSSTPQNAGEIALARRHREKQLARPWRRPANTETSHFCPENTTKVLSPYLPW